MTKPSGKRQKCKHLTKEYLSLGNWWCPICGSLGISYWKGKQTEFEGRIWNKPIEKIRWRKSNDPQDR